VLEYGLRGTRVIQLQFSPGTWGRTLIGQTGTASLLDRPGQQNSPTGKLSLRELNRASDFKQTRPGQPGRQAPLHMLERASTRFVHISRPKPYYAKDGPTAERPWGSLVHPASRAASRASRHLL